MRRLLSIVTLIAVCLTVALFIVLTAPEPPVRERMEKGGTSGAMAALDFWSRSRAYPSNDIPRAAYFKAFRSDQLRHNLLPQTMTAGSIWDPIGPLNLQGRCLSVALNYQNPSTIYVGTASGGLWRSHSGGTTGDWEQVLTGYPVLGVGAIAVDPSDSNTIFIGTGEVYRYQNSTGGLVIRTTRGSYGIGILKTTNGGTTWTKSLDWSLNNQTGVQALRINPRNHRSVWAATSEGVYHTSDGGSTWDAVLPGLLMSEDIVIHPVDTTKMLISAGNFMSSVVLRTTDAGAHWDPSGLPSYTGKVLLDYYMTNPDIVYASAADSTTAAGALYKSTDFGGTWVKQIEYPGDGGGVYQVQGWYSHFVAVHPTDPAQIVHAGVPPFKSTDGGLTFFSATGGYSDNHSFVHHPTNPNVIYVANDDGVYRSDNFGNSYVDVGYGMQNGQLYNGFSCSSTDSLLAIGQSQDHIPGYIYRGSQVWNTSVVDETGWTATDPTNDNIMYAVNRYGTYVYRSTNRGNSFSYVYNTGYSGAWNSPIAVAPSNPTIVYCANMRVFKSTNRGSGWSPAGPVLDGVNSIISMAVAPTSSDTVFVGTGPISGRAKIFRTVNGGTNWTDVTGTSPDRYPIDIAVDPSNARIVYVAYGGFGGGHLYKSTDGGGTWNDVSGTLPDVPTTAVAIDPLHPANVYVGNDIGVYVSTNAGTSWAGFSEGLPDAVIAADLTISPSNRALRIATHGNGVWERRLLGELPANYFDYKAVSVTAPSQGMMYDLGAPLPSPTAVFRNVSANAQTDSFTVQFRILHTTTELYSAFRRVPGLGLAESRMVTFSPDFVPPDTGTYTAQAITLAGDNNAGNDTATGTIMVVTPSTLYNFTSQKLYSPYQQISGGSAGPTGDDVQLRVPLPFTFRYDNCDYDSAQISTNGWVEFGTGTRGSLRGLSTDGQIGGYFSATLPTTGHPTKTVGPWFNDLIIDGTGGDIEYLALGSPPNRIFVVQWKAIAVYGTSTYLNFQLRLHETSNDIEFCYGPVTVGTFPSGTTGASVGCKDYIGGDGRTFDVRRDEIATSLDFRSDLSPLTDWPGPDSTFLIRTNPSGVTAHLLKGWNLVSNPVSGTDYSVGTVFPGAVSRAFVYSGSYHQADSIFPNHGYWLKFPAAVSQPMVGSSISIIADSVQPGWNIIGSVDHPVAAPTGGIITSQVFGYNGHYTVASTIVPGQGYWVKTNAAGLIILGAGAAMRASSDNLESCSSITVTDRLGRTQTLYLAPAAGINAARYELPPVPPDGQFDVRFASQRMLESLPGSADAAVTLPVQLRGVDYPLVITYTIRDAAGSSLAMEADGGTRTLRGSGSVVLQNGSFAITARSTAEVPHRFALHQNYPNPFNPSTTIGFDLPVRSVVSVVMTDLLGREVMIAASGMYEAGSWNVTADFRNYSSGIYLCRMMARPLDGASAQPWSDVRKVLFLK